MISISSHHWFYGRWSLQKHEHVAYVFVECSCSILSWRIEINNPAWSLSHRYILSHQDHWSMRNDRCFHLEVSLHRKLRISTSTLHNLINVLQDEIIQINEKVIWHFNHESRGLNQMRRERLLFLMRYGGINKSCQIICSPIWQQWLASVNWHAHPLITIIL